MRNEPRGDSMTRCTPARSSSTARSGSRTRSSPRLRFDAASVWVGKRHVARAEIGPIGEGTSPFPHMMVFLQDRHERLLLERLEPAGVTVARAYVEFLYGDEGQEIAARNYFRPRNAEVAARHAGQFPDLTLFTIDDAFGSWSKAQATHFADGGTFDQTTSRAREGGGRAARAAADCSAGRDCKAWRRRASEESKAGRSRPAGGTTMTTTNENCRCGTNTSDHRNTTTAPACCCGPACRCIDCTCCGCICKDGCRCAVCPCR